MNTRNFNLKILAWVTGALVVAFAGYFAWRVYHARNQPFPIIESGYISPVSNHYGDTLSPDGNAIYVTFTGYIDSQDGKLHPNPLAGWDIPTAGEFLSMSPDGRFMTAGTGYHAEKYFFNTESGTYEAIGFLCKSWSSDSSRCIDLLRGDLIEIPENKIVTDWPENVDFREVEKVSGNGDYLWDEERTIPIAYINPCPIRDNTTGEVLDTWCKLVTPTFFQGLDGYSVSILEVTLPDSVVGWTFDPTGTYVLFAIWERVPGTYTENSYYISAENVTDTRLVLVNWRTKQSVELARLSDYVTENPAAVFFGDVQWSADGGTIMVPCVGGRFLVLKVKYP